MRALPAELPDDPSAEQVDAWIELASLVADPGFQRRVREMVLALETFTDERVERYWQLVGILNGRPPFAPRVPAFRWLISALRAHT